MRISEWICVSFLALFCIQALIRPVNNRNRLKVLGLGCAGLLLIFIGTTQSVIRDWVPIVIMLLIYWQGGSFFSKANSQLQNFLERFDEKLGLMNSPNCCNAFWEIIYFFCYPLVPAAVFTLYALHLRGNIDFFWTVVLPPTLLCHLFVSFFQTHPPWKVQKEQPARNGTLRRLNFLVIRYASIQMDTFPSAHVAASMAIAFAMLHLHWISGIVFLFLAIAIAISTVVGRYHFAADAVIGFFLALAWYLFIV